MAKNNEDQNIRRAAIITLALIALAFLSGVWTQPAPVQEQKVVQTSGVVSVGVEQQPVTESGIVKVNIQKNPTS